MQVKFYGVRGSIASAGEETRRYGGNTSCVTVTAGDDLICFDAGTGIRRLGTELGPTGVKMSLFFSHLHWDHIQGFPFFTPAFVPGNELNVYGVRHAQAAGVKDALAAQMKPPSFPVPLDIMQSDLAFRDIPVGERIRVGKAEVRHATVDHPNGCVAYRVDHGGHAVVYATDLEHHGAPSPELIELCQGADLLIYDAMYTPEEYEGDVGPSRHGWGHSTFDAGADLAEKAGVDQLVLFHHDPSHDDTFMDNLGGRARRRFTNTVVAREGMELTV
jgi:phosphoribosyl 1,2-cyclic phosphodiesterase